MATNTRILSISFYESMGENILKLHRYIEYDYKKMT